MTALALFRQLHALGVVLKPNPDGTLHYKAPKGTLTPELLDALRQHKAELYDLLETFEEHVAIVEYDGGLARAEAERLAWEWLVTPTPHGTVQPKARRSLHIE